MDTQTLNRPTRRKQQARQRVVLSVAPRNYAFLMELLGNFNFVKVEEDTGDSREDIIANLKGVAEDLKLLRAGKLETRSARELLNEI